MPLMPPLHSKSKTIVLDGGLGTTLESIYGKRISSTPLWSARPIVEDPDSIIQAHLSFLNAGARIIQTSTYQCTPETFRREGYSDVNAEKIMLESVRLANEARSRYIAGIDDQQLDRADVGIALSLGPFGASLFPSGEFNGVYPPPYGPATPSTEGYTSTWNSFEDEGDLEKSIERLEQFHLDRMAVFAKDLEVWEMIDYVAFETVPLVREVKAIRRAMSRLPEEVTGPNKLWWISCVFPDGQFPEFVRPGGPKLSVRDVVNAVLGEQKQQQGGVLVPTGIGINCTPLSFLPELLADMTKAVVECLQQPEGQQRLLLVMYPGGSGGNDSSSPAGSGEENRRRWAAELGCIAKKNSAVEPWAGVVVGGCCMVGPTEIHELCGYLNE